MKQRLFIAFQLSLVFSLSGVSQDHGIAIGFDYVYNLNERYGRYKDVHPDNRLPSTNYYFASQPRHGAQCFIQYNTDLKRLLHTLDESFFGNHISLSLGIKASGLGHYARHQVGFESLGIVQGAEHRLYHYELDKTTMIYLAPYASMRVDLMGYASLSYALERSLLVSSSTDRRDLNVNNPIGYFSLSNSYHVGDLRQFNPSLSTQSLYLSFSVKGIWNVRFGHQWSRRSMFRESYVWYPNAFPFRMFSAGIDVQLNNRQKEIETK